MKRKLLVASFLCLLATTGFASYKQHVKVCANVLTFRSTLQFKASFESSDTFDWGVSTPSISNGFYCVDHTYSYGPKNIRLTLEARNIPREDVKLILDPSCYYLKKDQYHYTYKSGDLRTGSPEQLWVFHITQLAPQADIPNIFQISCQHNSN